jgi:hypothetical protein
MYNERLQACAVFELYKCVVASPSHFASCGNIACAVYQFIRSSKCCVKPRPPPAACLLNLLATCIGRLLTVGFHEVCMFVQAAALHRPSAQFVCVLTQGFFLKK